MLVELVLHLDLQTSDSLIFKIFFSKELIWYLVVDFIYGQMLLVCQVSVCFIPFEVSTVKKCKTKL